ncbi:MAG: hypothetical protein Q4A61_04145 [Porphyromonadaceae bacterium]|nr:hypothetical protein [Porphyromonadaceae bacterium]
MNKKYYILFASALLALGACSKVEEEPAGNIEDQGKPLRINITGSFEQPEWVHVDNEHAMRNFVLRPNQAGYPKIVLTSLEGKAEGFEAYPSIVHLYNSQGKTMDYRLEVEDDLNPSSDESDKVKGNNKIVGASNEEKGTSRIVKRDGSYRVQVGFETSGKRGFSSGSSKKADVVYPSPYNDSEYYVFVALNPKHRDHPQSNHRIYYPYEHRVVGDNSSTPSMPALKHTIGDYEVARPSNVSKERDNHDGFVIPVFSDFHRRVTKTNDNLLQVETQFHMSGVLVALKLDNRTGRDIIVKRLRTRSNDLSYSGYYELWDFDWCNPKTGPNQRFHPTAGPIFVRYDSPDFTRGRARVYTYDVKDASGARDYSLSARSSSPGRFYLWGAIDEGNPRHGKASRYDGPWHTLMEIEYAYANQPNRVVRSATVDITPTYTTKRRFEYGKAYLVTLPIKEAGS